ncbi:MAG: hypothetical protein ACP5US_03210 [Candidatus Kryptoniota bacterium]
MKPDELSLFEKLVIGRMALILLERYNVRAEGKRRVLEACGKLDDPNLNELSFALKMIEKGTYGQCVICRHDIPSAILKENLTARLCPSCESVINEKNSSSSTST